MLTAWLHRRRKAATALEKSMEGVQGALGAVERSRQIYGTRLLVRGLLWLSIFMLSRGLLELDFADTAARVGIALAPIPFFIWFLWTWMKGVAAMDELEQKIELEALAFAFPVAVVVLMTLGLMELAVDLNPDDWSYRHVWAMMPALYYIGLWRAKRRYQ